MAKQVLVVDDEPGIVKMVASRLNAAGYRVVTATDGVEGLRKCKLVKPDVAVLDVMMPGMPGDLVAEAMKDDPALSHIPVIFLTALVKKDETAETRPIAGYYYLAKPFKGNELLELLERVVRQTPTKSR
jgi:two-component system, OmpR family, alkaline phosphatase synthesis response regulator PhoP